MNPDDAQPGNTGTTDSSQGVMNRPQSATYTPPKDPSQYMRTYARDIAQLSQTPAPVQGATRTPVSTTPVVDTTSASSGVTTTDGVTLQEFDASPVNQKDAASPKEFKAEVVSLSEADSDGIFANKATTPEPAAPRASSLMPQNTIDSAPTITPVGTVPPPAASMDRESILERLHLLQAKKTAVPSPEPIAIPVQEFTPVEQAREVEPTIPPLTPRIPETTVPPAATRIFSRPIPAPDLTSRSTPAEPATFHTFSSDFADRIDEQKASTFSVLAAESNQTSAPRVRTTQRTNFLPIFIGAALVILGVGIAGGAYVFIHKTPQTTVPTLAGVPSLVTFDESVAVQGSGSDLMRAIADVASQTSVPGNVIVTYIPTGTSSTPQAGGALIASLPLGAPDILLRNIDPASTIGVVNAEGESRPFLTLKVNSYERTFAGMLAWEPTMLQNLALFYPAYPLQAITIASSSASSTSPAILSTGTFTDAIVDNHDVRIIRDSQGRSRLLYGYHNKNILIIARDEAAFALLIDRLTSTGK